MTFAEFRLDSVEIKEEFENSFVTGDFSCLEGRFISHFMPMHGLSFFGFKILKGQIVLKRMLGYYVVQIYVPSLVVTACSIASYWVKLQIAPARSFLAIG